MRLADIAVLDTPAARLADEVARRYTSAALYGHSVRPCHWGAAWADLNGLDFDAELLYVAALLHDLGLTAPFDAHEVPFEAAGGEVAWVFCAAAGWPPARRQRILDVIVKHMWTSVDPRDDPEGHLLEGRTSVDISGSRLTAIPTGLQREVAARWPRGALATGFAQCCNLQAARKPSSRAAAAVRSDVGDRLQANPLGGPVAGYPHRTRGLVGSAGAAARARDARATTRGTVAAPAAVAPVTATRTGHGAACGQTWFASWASPAVTTPIQDQTMNVPCAATAERDRPRRRTADHPSPVVTRLTTARTWNGPGLPVMS